MLNPSLKEQDPSLEELKVLKFPNYLQEKEVLKAIKACLNIDY